ncbi:bidirectional sugar transporter SWEET3b-like [Macadamia integrifolia]|uniref:bidirectional sugar transporter SWEET3b-like n=1 Tax=Macadamia integrifolia TaxID=60698 RepID=UPI001C4F6F13|nr:bidirectional sugar transporter SWEET3b-like [Macadamia integrifolia]
MEDKIRLALGIAGNVTSVLLYSSPILTFKRVIGKKSTEEFSCVPYIVTLCTVLLYFWYGLPIVSYKWENITVVTISGVGILLQSTFILIYIWFSSPRRKRMVILMVVTVIIIISITTLVSTFEWHDHHHRKLFVGSIGLMVNTGMYGSPLIVVKQVVQTKSVEFMPFYLSLFSLLNSSLWGPYGLLGHDLFIAIPNLLGVLLSLFQLVLYCIYRERKIHKELSDTDLEMNAKKAVPETSDQQRIQMYTGTPSSYVQIMDRDA